MASSRFENVYVKFKNPNDLEKLIWFGPNPDKILTAARHKEGLEIWMKEKTDFWQKTYYTPILVAHNGHVLHKDISHSNVLLETTFTLNASSQFDQAGLMVLIDDNHWIKTGLEYVDDGYRLSCVVTNNYSDWSTQQYPSGHLSIRIYKLGNNYVVEARDPDGASDDWNFIRICRLHVDCETPVKMGLYACSPGEKGGNVLFDYLSYSHTDGHLHTY